MKKKYTSLLVLLLSININYAQNVNAKYTSERNLSVEQAELQFKKDLELAKENNIPFEYKNIDGTTSKFVRFTDGFPVYYRTYNLQSATMMGATRLYPGGDLGLNLTGMDGFVGVWDEDRVKSTHIGFAGRVYFLDSSSASFSNHQTHVMGTILSNGSGSSNLSGRGIAFEAYGYGADWNNDIAEMQSGTTDYGITVSNHSYGADLTRINSSLIPSIFGKYTSDARSLDQLLYNNPKYLAVYAAGNDRDSYNTYNPSKGGADLLTGDSLAKNCLTVAAVNGFSSYNGPSSVVMSGFSNWGPSDDFRIKPDISAKGVNVYSTIAGSTTSNNSYANLSGTSMASPGVTGAVLLLQQYFNYNAYSSKIKGLLLHTAKEAGDSDGPDHKFGWGLIDLGEAVYTAHNSNRSEIVDLTYTNAPTNYFIQANGNEDLKVSISWTDPAGAADSSSSATDLSSPKLVNDLDIRLNQNNTTYYPWFLTKDFSNLVADKGDNNVDNFERIDIKNPSGIYSLEISAKGTVNNQKYTLIVTGGKFVTNSVNDNLKNNAVVWVTKDKDLNIDLGDSSFVLDNIQIFDISGRLVLSKKAEISNIYNVSTLTNGYYILNMNNSSGEKISKKIYVK